MQNLSFSFVVPVYNRPDEIKELLASFQKLVTDTPFEIVIVEDGSALDSKAIINTYKDVLQIKYYAKQNSGPGDSRNFGMTKASGNYFIILDSDCILPPHYLQTVISYLEKTFVDCYGGPDASHDSFSTLQKAINFAMTSFITTGGIRGGVDMITDFQPRSFNMGLSKAAFLASSGFGTIHPGEDPDLSIRLHKLGFKTVMFPKAFVYHKRRISWNSFYTQVYKFGLVRPILNSWHPKSKKLTYWFPSVFCLGLLLALILLTINIWWPMLLYMIYIIIAFIMSLLYSRNFMVAFQSILAIFIQFIGYGSGFLKSTYLIGVLKKEPKSTFPKLFFDHAKIF